MEKRFAVSLAKQLSNFLPQLFGRAAVSGCFLHSETYVGSYQASVMELLSKNNKCVLAINYF